MPANLRLCCRKHNTYVSKTWDKQQKPQTKRHHFWDPDTTNSGAQHDGATTICKKLGYATGTQQRTREAFSDDALDIGKCGDGEALDACTKGSNDRAFTDWCKAGNGIGVTVECSGGDAEESEWGGLGNECDAPEWMAELLGGEGAQLGICPGRENEVLRSRPPISTVVGASSQRSVSAGPGRGLGHLPRLPARRRARTGG